jgi:Leucine-rich repeat (LRR) protein
MHNVPKGPGMNNGKIMNAPGLYLLGLGVAAIFNGCLPGTASENDSAKPAIPYCKTWECDSMVVRALLDGNGQPDEPIYRDAGSRMGWLSLSDIHTVPPEIGRLDELEYLVLRGDFPEVPISMGQLRSLKELELESEELADIGDWLGNLTHLDGLVIHSTSLTKLPNSAAKLKYLRRLDLADNLMDSLPEAIGGFTELRELDLENNRFQNLPSVIGNCPHLVTLSLNDNRLERLPATIGNFKNLRYLSLSGNPISELPEEITNLKELETLYLNGTLICTPSPNVRSWLDNVDPGWEDQIPDSACAGI